MRSLFEISSDFDVLDDLLVERDMLLAKTDGELTPEVAQTLEAVDALMNGLGSEFDLKADGYAAYIRHLETRAAARREESERMKMHAVRDENNAEFLKGRLRDAMLRLDRTKIETTRFKITVVNNGGKVGMTIPDTWPLAAPVEFVETVTRHVVNTDAVRKALESGREIPGACLRERGKRLAIK
ncbi:MAG: siphovirus Gp157 family protein [Acidobacteria bacterium]|nr:siphovirus Gp157 family protein [Acidobacteriota bacterium]